MLARQYTLSPNNSNISLKVGRIQQREKLQNERMMDDRSGDDDTGEVRWSPKNDKSGRGRSRRGWRSEWGSWFLRWGDA